MSEQLKMITKPYLQPLRVCVVTGGTTEERNVALAGAFQVVSALRGRGHHVVVVDTASGFLSAAEERRILREHVGLVPPREEELIALRSKELGVRLIDVAEVRAADVVFLLLHGRDGEGGSLQALFEMSRIRFTGSGFVGSTLAMDKAISKVLFQANGVPTPKWRKWPTSMNDLEEIGLPCVVKPACGGSTIGLTVIRDWRDLDAAVKHAQSSDRSVIVEEYINGREFTVGILGDQSLAVGEIIPDHGIFDYVCKYTPGKCREVFPAILPEEISSAMRQYALVAHQVLQLDGLSRIDFMLSAAGAIYCLEANTLPGMTLTSLFPQSAAVFGITFPELCEQICLHALEKPRR